jgi:sugar lactone lactonase YvrE
MNKLLLVSIFSILSALCFAQSPPHISYSSAAQVYTVNTSITALAPTNSGGAVSGIYGTVSTLAGNSSYNGLVNGTSTNASFNNPSGVTTDNAGNIYVADQSNNVIRKITVGGVVTTLAGNGFPGLVNGTGASAYFNNPCGVAVDAAGNVYVTDRYNNAIRKITPAGVVTTFAGGSGSISSVDGTGTAASFYYPYGITIDAGGNLFVAEQYGQRIRKITPAGVVTTVAGNGNTGSTNGAGTTATFYNPTGVAIDASGNLFVTDNMGNLVRKITPAGFVSTFAGSGVVGSANGTGTAASFNQPTGVNIDASGKIYIADQANNMIRLITSDGVVSTLAGNGTAAALNGLGIAATFSRPTGIAIGSGNIYVADYTNNLIRSIVTSGYSISPALPDGLVMDPQTGIITGTPNTITAAQNYIITAQNNGGASVATINIATVAPAVPPTITAISPSTAVIGAGIIITGTNFIGATGLTIGGKAVTSFTVATTIKIIAVVPTGAVSGNVVVTNPYGSATFSGLVIATAPAINYTTPHSYPTGAAITALAPTNTGGTVPTGIYSQVTTFAGSGNQQTTNGTGNTASFSYPTGMVADAEGNIYVAETYGNVIRKITPQGVVTTFAGSGTYGATNGTATAASFSNPISIAIDPSGNLFVADQGSSLIRKITPAGIVSTFAGNTTYNYTIINGVGTAAGFNRPTALAADASGNLYVADAGNNAIRKITPDGTVTTFLSSLNNPSGVAVDAAGNVYIADRGNNLIKKVRPDGSLSIFAGNGVSASVDGTGTSASFTSPVNIALDASGNLYITENQGLIRMITPAGIVTTLAGKTSANNSIDGIGTNAGFYSPWGIAADTYGNLYVSDQFSNKIRKISITGYTVQPTFPAGLTLDNTGAISGTPLAISTATDYVVKAVNIAGTSTATVNIATPIPALPPTVTTVTPSATGYGKSISITGTNLLGATSVKIGTVDVPFASISPFTLNAIVNTNITGSISITNPYGTATSAAFGITQAPGIAYTTGNIFTVGTAITNMSPANNGGTIPNSVYAQTSTFAGNGTYGNLNGTGTAAIIVPQGAVIDANNNIYLTDSYSQIRKITPAGVVTTIAGNGSTGSANGNGASATFNYPKGLAIDIAGNLYVADQSNHLIRKITPAGDVTTLAGSGSYGAINGTGTAASFYYPSGVAVDISGNVFVADRGNNQIRKITPAGVVSTFAGSTTSGQNDGTGTAASFNGPAGLAFDAKGNLFVADQYNGRIRTITPAGVVSTYAGSITGYADNSVSTAAKFNNPYALTVNSNGDVYVADMNNNAIRKITTDGAVTTIAGNGNSGAKDEIALARLQVFLHPQG